MARRSIGPRLRFLKKRGAFYIVWTEGGRTRERSTGTKDSAKAQIEFAQFLQRFTHKSGAKEPTEILVTEVLSIYLQHLETASKDCERAAYASVPLAEFFLPEKHWLKCRHFVQATKHGGKFLRAPFAGTLAYCKAPSNTHFKAN